MALFQRSLILLTLVLASTRSECPGGIPVFGSLTQAIPSLRNMPGLNFIPNKGAGFVPENKNLDSAIEQFSEPLVRFATGGQPVSSDIDQLISSIPNLLVNIPGVGNVDISKLPPQLIDHVLKGGQVPGVSKETLDAIMKQYMQKMYALAANAQNMQTDIILTPKDFHNAHRFLPPLTKLPQQFVTNVMEGKSLPFLLPNQTQVIKDYYIKRLPISQQDYSLGNDTNFPFSSKTIQMMKLLPPGYNLSNLPKEVLQQVMKGEFPDVSKLPDDILQYIRENADELFGTLSTMSNITIEEIIKKMPQYERPVQPTFSPYDINKVDSGGVISGSVDEGKKSRMRLLAVILLSFAGVITIVILAISCYYVKRKRANSMPSSPSGLSPGMFRPISTSTIDNRSSKASPNSV